MKHSVKRLLAGAMAAALCALSGCAGTLDNREDPLAGYNVDALLPFPSRAPEVAATATVVPGSTAIIQMTQGWQNEAGPAGSTATPRPTATASYPTYEYTRLQQGDVSEGVLRLQQRLIALGYLSGSADGKFGANTKAAVKLFQKALNLSQTGVATVSLQEKLFLSSAPTYVPVTTATATPVPKATASYQALVRGDRGEGVRAVQNRLIELGYLSGSADGAFGANTENAIRKFQAEIGLSQTGVASSSLQEILFSGNAPYAPVRATAKPTATPAPQPPSSSYQQLAPGDTGSEVRQMQTRLKELGYFTGNATGNYYKETTAAVKLFQAQTGMTETGIATTSFLRRLYAADAPVYSGETAEPDHSGGTYTILSRGSKGTEVLNLQKRLIALGYLSGTADGVFGANTEKAVKLVQSVIGYAENGIASVGFQNLLYSQNAPYYEPAYTAVPTARPTSVPSSRYTQLSPGDSGEEVRSLQRRLKELGFFSGVIGGNYLTKTTSAVKLFQAALGYSETGVATSSLQEILFSDSAPTYDSVESDYVLLEKQDSGIQVRYLQQRLIALGYLTGTADGDFGSRTESAVRAFQQQAGLPVTGKATADMQEVLFSSNAPYAPVVTQAPTKTPAPTPTAAPVIGNYRTLIHGNSGEDVKAVQRRLKELGYFHGEIGGNYLTQTTAAVKLFQEAAGYSADGVLTPTMQSFLFSAAAPAYSGDGYFELRKGSGGASVRALQNRLIELGYLTGTADGDFGSNTEKAVKRFQSAIGHDQTGVATAELQELLYSADAPIYTPPATRTPQPTDEPYNPGPMGNYRTLLNGDSGEDVRNVQYRLKELGYFDGNIGGNYLTKTITAVKLFQSAAGYEIDGVLTPTMQSLLFSDNAPVYTGSAYIDLEKGMSGTAVVSLQRRLIDLGYLSGSADGDFGGGTADAVKRFQSAVGHAPSGVATIAMQEILFSSDAPSSSGGGNNPVQPEEPDEPEESDDYQSLSYGSSGRAVQELQRRLAELGYFDGDLGGNYLKKTQAAVMLFQQTIGWEADGVASPALQKVLFSWDAPAYAPISRPDRLSVLYPGDRGSAVESLQNRLIQLGWLSGTADGDYGSATESAINTFQYRMGLEMDGVASIEVQELLYSIDAPAYVEYVDLYPGSQGDEVLALQMRMIELGYLEMNELNTDGIYGESLRAAIAQLQLAVGVEPQFADGFATIATQTFLFSENASLYAILPDVY